MEKGKIGRHGLGFNSIFNITDLPSILSGELLVQRSVGQCWAPVKSTLWLFPLFRVFPGMVRNGPHGIVLILPLSRVFSF